MSSKIKYIIGITLSVILFQGCCRDRNDEIEGCQKEAPENLGTFRLDSIKPYFYFPVGSWWVYENDSTKEVDSIRMVSGDLRIIHAISGSRVYDYESFTTTTRSYLNDYDVVTFNLGSNPDMVNWDFHLTWFRSRSKSGDFEGPVAAYSIPLIKDKLFSTASYYRGHLDSIRFGTIWYKDILVFEISNDPTWPDSNIPTYDYGKSTYYYARDIGLVAIKNLDNDRRYSSLPLITQTWYLKNYFINN